MVTCVAGLIDLSHTDAGAFLFKAEMSTEVFGMTLDIIGFVILLLVGLAAFFVILFGGVFFVLGKTARRKEASARERFPNARQIDRAASFFGQESLRSIQMRGNGTLILTASDLIFEMWVPNKQFRIPLRSIQSIENPTSFLGKSRFKPLLKVAYVNDQGAIDSMAWQVPDLGGWMRLLNETLKDGAL